MARRIRFRARVFASLLGVALPSVAGAHALAPSLLELREVGPEQAVVRWKQPLKQPAGAELRPLLPENCSALGEGESFREGTGVVTEGEIRCPGGFIGQRIGVEGLEASPTAVLLSLQLGDGARVRQVLTADRPSLLIPEREAALDVATGYVELGVEHILGGLDHLLFVLALVLLVRERRALFWTITAFTAGHSITLALAILEWIVVPQAPIEAAIAFSIYVLAVEIVRREEGRPTALERRPWWVAGGFGLLHGLGFAGALAEVGLPQQEIPLALVSFNVGIEVGQLFFVGLVLLGWKALRALPVAWPAGIAVAPAYAIGILAAFWFFERSWEMVMPV